MGSRLLLAPSFCTTRSEIDTQFEVLCKNVYKLAQQFGKRGSAGRGQARRRGMLCAAPDSALSAMQCCCSTHHWVIDQPVVSHIEEKTINNWQWNLQRPNQKAGETRLKTLSNNESAGIVAKISPLISSADTRVSVTDFTVTRYKCSAGGRGGWCSLFARART